MSFKWKITNPPYVERVDGVELRTPGVECEFETGSAAEALGVFEQEDAAFAKIFGRSPGASVDFGTKPAAEQQGAPTAEKPAARRGRPPKAAVEAVAPDPIPVPAVDPTTAADAPAGPAAAAPSPTPPPALPVAASPPIAAEAPGNGIPPFLDRTKPAAAPPPLPALPAVKAVAPPPVGVLGPKVVSALDKHREGKEDGGQALADWLAQAGLTIAGKSYDEAVRAVLMISDEKLTASGILAPLGVA